MSQMACMVGMRHDPGFNVNTTLHSLSASRSPVMKPREDQVREPGRVCRSRNVAEVLPGSHRVVSGSKVSRVTFSYPGRQMNYGFRHLSRRQPALIPTQQATSSTRGSVKADQHPHADRHGTLQDQFTMAFPFARHAAIHCKKPRSFTRHAATKMVSES
jgi:hypothetical protein